MIVYSSVFCKINTEDGTEIPTEWEYDPENMTIGDGFYYTYEEALADIRRPRKMCEYCDDVCE